MKSKVCGSILKYNYHQIAKSGDKETSIVTETHNRTSIASAILTSDRACYGACFIQNFHLISPMYQGLVNTIILLLSTICEKHWGDAERIMQNSSIGYQLTPAELHLTSLKFHLKQLQFYDIPNVFYSRLSPLEHDFRFPCAIPYYIHL